MNVNPIKIDIELNTGSNGKWYAKKEINKKGETKVTFFQRDGQRSLLQKFKDFKNNVRSGAELAKKYCNELGISDKAIANPKNKSANSGITNTELNKIFRSAYSKLINNESFQKSDQLVSNSKKEIDVSINNEPILSGEDFKKNTQKFLSSRMNYSSKNYNDFEYDISVALNIRADPNFSADSKQITKTIEVLEDLKNIKLIGYDYQELTNYENRKKEFDEKIDILITALNKATKKASNNSTTD